MSDAVLVSERLRAQMPEAILGTHQFVADDTAIVKRDSLRAVAQALRDTPEFACNMLLDLTAVDYLKYPAGRATPPAPTTRFEVVYHFYSVERNHRIRVKVPVEASDPNVPSLADLWASANWFEREVWDMFGIRFHGHPGLKRILMYEEFEGHALRKDYPVNQRQPLIGPAN